MDDLISRQAAIDIERNATVDTNPSHFEAHQKFTQFMDDAEISSFGRCQRGLCNIEPWNQIKFAWRSPN